jgi:hypothetical protein
MKNLDKKLNDFINQFPDNATNWSQATDEIRDLCRGCRESYNELVLNVVEGEKGYIDALDFRSFKTPSQWNTEAKKMIRTLWAKMDDWAKENALNSVIETN